jgi:hypothetical protein
VHFLSFGRFALLISRTAKKWFPLLTLSLLLPALAQAQDDSNASADAAVSTDADSSADAAQLGIVHGFVPSTWNASMISIADLQTQEGQDWFNGLQAAGSVHDQTQYVCSNPTQMVTSSNTGDFFFNDLPAGSYAVAACMQTPDGNWRSGSSVIALEPGETANVALGVAHGYPVFFHGSPVVVSYYVGFNDPFFFGPTWGWRWHVGMWGASFRYAAPAYRAAPIWIRPGVVVVGAHIVVPPYRQVYAGHYSYMAWRNGGFVRAAPHGGAFVPPVGVHAVVRPAIPDRIVNNNVRVVRTAIVNKTTINNVNRTTVVNNNVHTTTSVQGNGYRQPANGQPATTAARQPANSGGGVNNRPVVTQPTRQSAEPAQTQRASQPAERTSTHSEPAPQHTSSSSSTSTKKKPY